MENICQNSQYTDSIICINKHIALKLASLFDVFDSDQIYDTGQELAKILTNRELLLAGRPDIDINDELYQYINGDRIIEFLYKDGDCNGLEMLSQERRLYESNFKLVCILHRAISWYGSDIASYKCCRYYYHVIDKMKILLDAYRILRDDIHVCERCKAQRTHCSMMYLNEMMADLQGLIINVNTNKCLYSPDHYYRVLNELIGTYNYINRMGGKLCYRIGRSLD